MSMSVALGVLAATSWLERTLINAQQEVPRFLKEMRVARFSYQEGDHVVSLIDFHGVRKGDVGLVL